MPARPIVALLGGTGRLGPAVVRALAATELRALVRRPPSPEEAAPLVRYVIADRCDVEAVARVVDGADVVVDLLARDERDAKVLAIALERAVRPPTSIVVASCSSELRGGPVGRAKLAGRTLLAHRFSGILHALMLPRLVASIDPARREQAYLDDAAATGRALFAGSLATPQSMLAVQDAAEVVRRLVLDPRALPPGTVEVAPPSPITIGEAITALLRGAGRNAEIAHHPDPGHQSPHTATPDVLDGAAVRAAFPELAWTDPRAVYEALGAWLATTTAAGERPRRAVPLAHRRPEARATIDVHGARHEVALARPVEGLMRLTSWLSPSFYVDIGRPCNSACLYCAVPPHGDTHGFTPFEQVRAHVRAGIAAGCDRAVFVGGEPTIYPDLDEALAYLRAAGLPDRHAVMTNGLRLADAAFLEHLRALGVATIHLSIDTVDEAVYDQLSRSPGTFHRQRAALENALRSPGLQLYVYAAVTRLNVGGIDALLRYVAERADAAAAPHPPVLLAFVKPVGDAKVHAATLNVSPSERASIARHAVALGAELGITVGLRNLQACLAPELVAHIVDYYLDDYSVDLATLRRTPYAHNVELVHQLASCTGCAHQALCPGVYRDEEARGDTAAFRAIASDDALVTSVTRG